MSEYRRKKPSIRREGVDRTQGFGGHYEPLPVNERKKTGASQPETPETKPPAPQPEPTKAAQPMPRPDTPNDTPAEAKAKPESGKRWPTEKDPSKAEKPAVSTTAPAQRDTQEHAGDRRETMKKVALTAYPKAEQRAALEAAASDAVPIMDMVKLAGRRALARFVPKADYTAVPDVKRMGSKYRYTTTKQVSERLLETLHHAVNPLGLEH